eukprot:361489-Chlamydomonas_euryale.AAC.2
MRRKEDTLLPVRQTTSKEQEAQFIPKDGKLRAGPKRGHGHRRGQDAGAGRRRTRDRPRGKDLGEGPRRGKDQGMPHEEGCGDKTVPPEHAGLPTHARACAHVGAAASFAGRNWSWEKLRGLQSTAVRRHRQVPRAPDRQQT